MAPKKGDDGFKRAHRYLNYGLLSLASRFREPVLVLHGNFVPPSQFIEIHWTTFAVARVALLSIPSFYALPWAEKLFNIVQMEFPKLKVHIGGRWVVDRNAATLQQRFKGAHGIHAGIGDLIIEDIASAHSLNLKPRHEILRNPTLLDYSLLHEKEDFHPSLEVSRGCGMGCSFCEESSLPLTQLKLPELINDEVSAIENVLGPNKNFYFESSFFSPSQSWVTALSKIFASDACAFKWRAETRVDTMSPKKVIALGNSGLRVIDLGLESASAAQLTSMGKTSNPERYLDLAEQLLGACKEAGVKAKVNIMLFPGENSRTIDQTVEWLEKNRRSIFGLSVYPVLIFGMGERAVYFGNEYKKMGATGIKESSTEGVWEVDLSVEIDRVMAKKLSLEISREFMSAENYFELKSFSYLPSSYSKEIFLNDIKDVNTSELPFHIVEEH